MNQIDFFCRSAYYLDHMIPVWDAIHPDNRGDFYLSSHCAEEARKYPHIQFMAYMEGGQCGDGPILTASYGDATRALECNDRRPVILIEHGAGLTFGKAAYADGLGQRTKMSLLPVQNSYILNKVHPELKHIPHPIVGMPKLDPWAGKFAKHIMGKNPTVAISFHHGTKNSRPAEIGSAGEHYIGVLPELAGKFNLIVHAHPIISRDMKEYCRSMGLPFVADFNEVMRRADIYINDASSTLYEFMVTGKPVIILNAPWFDRKANWGLRFWDFTDIGPQVDYPDQLIETVERVVTGPDTFRPNRSKAVSRLFPYLGSSAQRMADEISKHLKFKKSTTHIPSIQPKTTFISKMLPIKASMDQGILYMAFGDKAREEMENSITTLRNTNNVLPVCVLGDEAGMSSDPSVYGISTHIPWKGESPFDKDKANGFQFRAGRVKPFIYGLSPFKETLYMDSDTRFLKRPDKIFGFLNSWDFVIAQERLSVSQLYNKPRAGWAHNLEERDATVEEFGGDGNFPFWNSGVFLFKKNKAVEDLFKHWHREWMRWQQWDEQLSLMRAANRSKVRVFVLSEIWNFPHEQGAEIILHLYGRGAARIQKEKI